MKWVIFNCFVLIMLALDLGLFHKKSKTVSLKNALAWTSVWVVLALVYNVGIYYYVGPQKALEFFTGYLLEKSLSVDNIFVFVMIFSYFKVPKHLQHGVLMWGIIGALVMRAILIFAGISLVQQYEWLFYLFGAFLIFTGAKMLIIRENDTLDNNTILNFISSHINITKNYHGEKFIVKKDGKRFVTPLFVALVMVEFSDLIFAFDSIPAIFAVTLDPFIVYTANVFAILGLRSLYFVMADMVNRFQYLKYGISGILIFIGFKLLIMHYYKIPTLVSLTVIAACIIVSAVISIMHKEGK